MSSLIPITPTSLTLTPLRQRALENLFNVKDYGAAGDGATDDYSAIQAAYQAIPATGGTLYFPPGNYWFGTALSFTNAKHLAIVGEGADVTKLTPTFAAGDAVTVNGPDSFVTVSRIAITESVARNTGTYLLKIRNCLRPLLTDLWLYGYYSGLLALDGCNTGLVSNVEGATTQGVGLRMTSSYGMAFSNCAIGTGAQNLSPCVWITGSATSNKFANCDFGGGGPTKRFNISSISSTGTNFTVTTSVAHTFAAGDFVVIRNASVAAYNDQWRIASVGATTIVVTSALNPGAAAAVGTAESVAACFYVSNSLGPCNESLITGCQVEGGGGSFLYGYAGMYFDGRTITNSIEGWTITGCWFDYGATGLLISGQSANASFIPTVYGFTVTGCVFGETVRAVHIDQAANVIVTGCSGDSTGGGGGGVADKISATAGIYVYAGPGDPWTKGITITGNNFGWPRDFDDANNTSLAYGLLLDSAGIQDLVVVGNQFTGTTAGIGMVNSALAAAQRWKIKGNNITSGTLPVANSTYQPTIASAATIDLTNYPFDSVIVTGTANIATINGGWIGREILMLATAAWSFATGGNIAIGVNRTQAVGIACVVVFDGTSWYVK